MFNNGFKWRIRCLLSDVVRWEGAVAPLGDVVAWMVVGPVTTHERGDIMVS